MRNSLLALNLTLACTSLLGATNIITREIHSEGEDVRVEDTIHLTTGTWNTVPNLQDILSLKRRNKGNEEILNAVRNLVRDEALEVTQCNAELREGMMLLHIVSNVKVNLQAPVKVKCLSSYAGSRFLLPLSGSEVEPFMLVFAGPGIRLLWLPEWDDPVDLTKAVKEQLAAELDLYERFQFTNYLHMRCVLKVDQDDQVLFEASPWNRPQPLPNSEFCSIVQHAHNMSGGDWRRLFTNIKPGKSGFYLIKSRFLTNRARFFSPNTTRRTPQRLSRSGYQVSNNTSGWASTINRPATKFVIDGSFDDWRQYQMAWADNKVDSNRIKVEGMEAERLFMVTECDSSADTNYIYLFLKFEPTIETRFRKLNPEGKLRSFGNVGVLYFDADVDKNTGAQGAGVRDHIVGCDIMISVTAGTFATPSNAVTQVSYHMLGWNAESKDFDLLRYSESSVTQHPLVSHGKDGVELAIPIKSLLRVKRDRIVLVFESDAPWESHREIPIELK